MTKRMLIDASHPEETRVVVVNDNLVEDFDYESSTKKQIKGNIYLAKVTRVEPSLQAAFVDYGGNRHGFLAFSEIHPDYYQIPQADRRLLEETNRIDEANRAAGEPAEGNGAAVEEGNGENRGEAEAVATDPDEEAAEVFDEQARRRSELLRGYKIQEVIKRRQIMLVQVVKEERGTKGAALTTYLSLAGRYCVLMPNTARGGGISRKIAIPADRARLKAIARELKVPDGMGLIIRTAGQQRNKLEIRRDYEYLLRLWSDIRELTLKSIAPCTIHEEGALVHRAIRDLYARDVDEVLVEGEEAYRTARKVMSMLMPSRTRRVKLYRDEVPLFHCYEVEDRLDAMHSPVIQLKSGGSIVIHTTEALTAIDVNSGRATRERNIEETALKTNLEAGDEIARQLRLRDLAGLVVVDFIDMAEMRNQRAVERRFREALKSDRARVQVGRISPFGLLELSRQRLRPSFQELSTQPCPTCAGTGAVRSTESAALQVLRAIELEGLKGTTAAMQATLPLATALYILNQKRSRLVSLEKRYGMSVAIRVSEDMIAGSFELECTERRTEAPAIEAAPEVEAEAPAAAADVVASDEDAESGGRKRRRRRRRRKRPSEGEPLSAEPAARVNGEAPLAAAAPAPEPEWAEAGASPMLEEVGAPVTEAAVLAASEVVPAAASTLAEVDEGEDAVEREKRPARRRRSRSGRAAAQAAPDAVTGAAADGNGAAPEAESGAAAEVVPESAGPMEAEPAAEPEGAAVTEAELTAGPEAALMTAAGEEPAWSEEPAPDTAGASAPEAVAGVGELGEIVPFEATAPQEEVPPQDQPVGQAPAFAPATGQDQPSPEPGEEAEAAARSDEPTDTAEPPEEDVPDEEQPMLGEVPSPAVVEQESGALRRGWWSRFVRKDN